MPGHDIHKLIKKIVYGRNGTSVDELMDWPVAFAGKSHRKYLHDPASVIALFGSDPQKMEEALLHLLVDDAFTKNPEARRVLEALMGKSRVKA